MHALRHYYASVLLDSGENIKALAEYLGHSDPGCTLRTYTTSCPTVGTAPAGPSTPPSAYAMRHRAWRSRCADLSGRGRGRSSRQPLAARARNRPSAVPFRQGRTRPTAHTRPR
uniref:tyrosine-type recombinase/integrase n=1 Tax=Streptomyces murinus TaxID=33900 RepID=UPI00372D63D7